MDSAETYRDFYEFEAHHYRTTPEEEESWKHRRTLVHRLLPADAVTSVLDVGCGDGALAEDLGDRYGCPVLGIDLAAGRTAYARSRSRHARFAQASVYALPFPDQAFDLVTCTDLLEHLDDPTRAMQELVRVARRAVIVTVPYKIQIEKTLCTHCGKDYFLYGHQHSFGEHGLRDLARAAGARATRFEHVIPMFECRRYKWFPPLKWLIWDHFKDTGTLGVRVERG
ncbi:MAG: class I SAM-dependent methyltransferase [Planctomycetes bacterium]|nr:class I SAM-dependent methyltransferase [Planctomycetota bacterium]